MLYLIAFILGAAGAFTIYKYGPALGLMDHPNHRGSHDNPTPKSGGIGILVAFGVAAIQQNLPVGFWLPIVVVALVGLYDDKVNLSPHIRLLIQFAATIWLIASVPMAKQFIMLPFWAIFIVGTANCYNFMDGINGIAAITGVVGFGLSAVFNAYFIPDNALTTLSICIMLACAAFLPFNLPKARVFMGDVGALLLGILYGSIVFMNSNTFSDFLCFIAFMFPFYVDEATTKLVQIRDGDSLTRPHRKHFYQLVTNEKGMAHWKIALGYGVVQLFVGVSMLWLRQMGWKPMLLALVIFLLIFLGINRKVRKRYLWRGISISDDN